MQVVFGANIDLQGGKYGNAVLTKFPVIHYENVLLPSVDQGEQRGVMVVAVQLPAMDFPLYILATHLDFRRDDTERMASIEQIEEIAAEREKHPIMLVGDLNATRTSSTLRQLQKSWKIAGDQEQPTSPVANPIRQIDFILVRPPQKWQVIETKVLDEKVASDHRAILAIVELKID
jgi:endonuclease/exonuclease/phosphatase family metal-dependent hydrolase